MIKSQELPGTPTRSVLLYRAAHVGAALEGLPPPPPAPPPPANSLSGSGPDNYQKLNTKLSF